MSVSRTASASTSAPAAMPKNGTSIENGATVEAPYRRISPPHAAHPASVDSPAM